MTRTTLVATSASLAAVALLLAGCSGGSGGGGLYQDSELGWEYMLVTGDEVVHVNPTRENLLDSIDDLDHGDVDRDAEYVEDTGTLNDAGDTVIWSDGDDDAIEIADDMVRWDGTVFISYDSNQATATRAVEIEDWHEHND